MSNSEHITIDPSDYQEDYWHGNVFYNELNRQAGENVIDLYSATKDNPKVQARLQRIGEAAYVRSGDNAEIIHLPFTETVR